MQTNCALSRARQITAGLRGGWGQGGTRRSATAHQPPVVFFRFIAHSIRSSCCHNNIQGSCFCFFCADRRKISPRHPAPPCVHFATALGSGLQHPALLPNYALCLPLCLALLPPPLRPACGISGCWKKHEN